MRQRVQNIRADCVSKSGRNTSYSHHPRFEHLTIHRNRSIAHRRRDRRIDCFHTFRCFRVVGLPRSLDHHAALLRLLLLAFLIRHDRDHRLFVGRHARNENTGRRVHDRGFHGIRLGGWAGKLARIEVDATLFQRVTNLRS